MRLELLEKIDPQAWDAAIEPFASKYLFHQSAWLDFLEETQRGRALRFKICDEQGIQGYFAGLLLRKGPLKILGSPLQGWTTNYMGPIVNQGFSTRAFLGALDEACRRLRIDHVELNNPILDHEEMVRAGFGVSEGKTFVVSLFPDEEETWSHLKSVCRNRIRKGQANGLVVRDAEDPAFVEEYYRELQEVFAKQKLVPTYPIARVRSLYRHLKPDLLLALQVEKEGEVLATGVFPHDRRRVYFYGGASWLRAHKLCPNELLHWTAITLASHLGVREYDMCGSGSFKPKFGGEEMSIYRYYKSYSPLARLGRGLYRSAFYARQRLLGALRRIPASAEEE